MIVTEESRQASSDLPNTEALVTEALIKEARRRQRLRWFAVVTAVLVLAVVSAVLVTHFTSPAKKTTTRTVTKPTTALPTCLASQMLAANGPPLGGASEEGSFTVALANRGHGPCVLNGYPQVNLVTSAGAVLSLPPNAHSGFVTTAAPRPVTLGIGATGYILVAEFACVLGDLHAISRVRLALPGTGADTAFTIPIVRSVGALAFCKGGPAAPGNSLAVSPVEATLGATLPQPERS